MMSSTLVKKKKKYAADEVVAAYVFLLPALVAIAVIIAYPLIEVIRMSFTNSIMSTGASNFVGWKNYVYLINNSKFQRALLNTACFAGGRVVLGVPLALIMALLLDCKVPARKFIRVAHFAPVVVPVVATAMIWRWFYDPGVGPLNQVLEALGLGRSRWIYSEDTALLSILIYAVWSYFGYNVILLLSSLQNITDSYLEAAYLDGATEIQVTRYIKIPLIKPVISFVAITEIINGFNTFTIVNILTPNGGPKYSTELAVNYIYDQGFVNGYIGRGAAAAMLVFLMLLIFTIIQQNVGKKGAN